MSQVHITKADRFLSADAVMRFGPSLAGEMSTVQGRNIAQP
jgi:hypothetical protein